MGIQCGFEKGDRSSTVPFPSPPGLCPPPPLVSRLHDSPVCCTLASPIPFSTGNSRSRFWPSHPCSSPEWVCGPSHPKLRLSKRSLVRFAERVGLWFVVSFVVSWFVSIAVGGSSVCLLRRVWECCGCFLRPCEPRGRRVALYYLATSFSPFSPHSYPYADRVCCLVVTLATCTYIHCRFSSTCTQSHVSRFSPVSRRRLPPNPPGQSVRGPLPSQEVSLNQLPFRSLRFPALTLYTPNSFREAFMKPARLAVLLVVVLLCFFLLLPL